MEETWVSAAGSMGLYEVSDAGRVRNSKTGKVLSQSNRRGYMRVNLYYKGWSKMVRVHRLVLQSFRPRGCGDGPECDHINGVPGDNRLSNLRWATRQQNRRKIHERKNHNRSSKY